MFEPLKWICQKKKNKNKRKWKKEKKTIRLPLESVLNSSLAKFPLPSRPHLFVFEVAFSFPRLITIHVWTRRTLDLLLVCFSSVFSETCLTGCDLEQCKMVVSYAAKELKPFLFSFGNLMKINFGHYNFPQSQRRWSRK